MLDDLNFLALFRHESDVIALEPGETLFHKGDPAHTMYVVKAGELQVVDGDAVYETVAAGGVLGEMALVDGAPRSAAARAVIASEVVPVDERRFLSMVQHTPFFALRLMRVMSNRLRRMNERAKTPG